MTTKIKRIRPPRLKPNQVKWVVEFHPTKTGVSIDISRMQVSDDTTKYHLDRQSYLIPKATIDTWAKL